MTSLILSRKHYALFTLGFILFVVYASLVPLKFRATPFSEGWPKFLEMMQAPIQVDSISDWVSNILLFIPLGFAMMGMIHADRHQTSWGAVIILPFCTLFSAGIEFTQIWFPPRHTSPNDVIAESLGGLIGILGWVLVGQRWTATAREIWQEHGAKNWAIRLLPGYCFILVVLHAMPFDISINPGELAHKYRLGMIRPVPFDYRPKDDPIEFIEKTAFNIGYFLPAGVLLAAIRRPDGSPRFSLASVLGIGCGLTGVIELMQVFIISRFADSTDILTGTLGVFLGWSLLRMDESRHEGFSRSLRFGSLVFWCMILIGIHWFPFQFSDDPVFLRKRLETFPWLPFEEYQYGDYLNSFNNILRKTLLFVPIGMVIEGFAAALFLGGFFAVVIEMGQFFLPSRFPGVTDPLIETFGTYLGFLAVTRLRSYTRNPEGER